jgi:uncharacterized protein (TIGR02466 family)
MKINLFPTCVFEYQWSKHAFYKNNLIDYCLALEDTKSEILVSPGIKHNLFESNFNFLDRDDEFVSELKKFMYESLWTSVSDMNTSVWKNGNKRMAITESWCHVTHSGGYHDIHTHENGCSWCGIYYLELGASNLKDKNGINRFYNQKFMSGHKDSGNEYLSDYIDVPPAEGKLIIFPSHLPHSALAYMGSSPRFIISFNAVIGN